MLVSDQAEPTVHVYLKNYVKNIASPEKKFKAAVFPLCGIVFFLDILLTLLVCSFITGYFKTVVTIVYVPAFLREDVESSMATHDF